MSREGGGHTTQTSHSLEPKDGTDLPIPGDRVVFDIAAREGIGRAKSVPADRYVENYKQLQELMVQEIDSIVEKGEVVL